MSKELTAEERRQIEASKRGVCARCEKPAEEHIDGTCPDGGGSYSWAVEDVPAAIATLENALSRAKGNRPN